jgi:hypothetical protein
LPEHHYVSVTHKRGFDFFDSHGPFKRSFVRALWLSITGESLFFALTSATSSASFAGRSWSIGHRATSRSISRQWSARMDLMSRNRFLVAFGEFRGNGSFSTDNRSFLALKSRLGFTDRDLGHLISDRFRKIWNFSG